MVSQVVGLARTGLPLGFAGEAGRANFMATSSLVAGWQWGPPVMRLPRRQGTLAGDWAAPTRAR